MKEVPLKGSVAKMSSIIKLGDPPRSRAQFQFHVKGPHNHQATGLYPQDHGPGKSFIQALVTNDQVPDTPLDPPSPSGS